MSSVFDPACQGCPRLAGFLCQVRQDHPQYHAAPVPAFGSATPRLLIVGLAPGLHGANRTGRPFTGDYAGILLYATLHRFGFSSAPESVGANDGLQLQGCRITNAVKCLPPANKPTGDEIRRCNAFLATELAELSPGTVVLALGTIAHQAVIRARGGRIKDYPFAHGAEFDLDQLKLIDSYHCSRYNTQTKRLTPAMFEAVVARARDIIRA